MKKLIVLLAVILSIPAIAQIQSDTATYGISVISNTKRLATYSNGDVYLTVTTTPQGDTIYTMRLRRTEAYDNVTQVLTGTQEIEHVSVILGSKRQAVSILRSMIDFSGDDNTRVSLNNPSNNTATYNVSRKMLGRGWQISDEMHWTSLYIRTDVLEDILYDIQNIIVTSAEDKSVKEHNTRAGLFAIFVAGAAATLAIMVLTLGRTQ